MTAAEGTARFQAVEQVREALHPGFANDEEAAGLAALSLLEHLAEAAERLEASVTPLLPTMNFYFGPGARTAVSHENVKAYRELALAAKDTATAVAAVRAGRADA